MKRPRKRNRTRYGEFTPEFADFARFPRHPEVWRALRAVLPPPPATILDLGAGPGVYVRSLQELGYAAIGVDGTPDIVQRSDGAVWCGNIAQPIFSEPVADWTISIEVGEHIPRRFCAAYLGNMTAAARHGIFSSWSEAPDRRSGHVNPKPPEWVARQYAKFGWHVDQDATGHSWRLAGPKWGPRILVFRPAAPGDPDGPQQVD